MYLNPQALTVSAPQHCVNELLLHGADVTRTNINGESAVALAVNCRSAQAQGRKLKCIVVIFVLLLICPNDTTHFFQLLS